MIEELTRLILQVAPIDGISVGDINDKSTWKISFKPDATPAQQVAAQGIIDSFDTVSFQQKLQRILDRQNNSETEAALATQLKNLTPQQAVDYIEANVTTLATAKTVLKIMARMLIALRDKVMPDLPEL